MRIIREKATSSFTTEHERATFFVTASTTRPLPRLRTADRQQLIPAMPLENLLEQDRQARLVWDFCLGLDLSSLYEPIPARAGGPGRAAIDPRLGVALCLRRPVVVCHSRRRRLRPRPGLAVR